MLNGLKLSLKNIIKSSSVHYIITRYFTFGLHAINALLIAKYLGLYYFGLYSFVNLLLQYFSYTNLGMSYSLTVILSTEKNIDNVKARNILFASLVVLTLVGFVLLAVTVISSYSGFINLFSAYLLNDYYVVVVLIAILQHFNILLINLFRIYGKLNEININYVIVPLSQLVCVFFFVEQYLFWALIISLAATNFVSLSIFLFNSPLKVGIKNKFSKDIALLLVKRGILLLAYNSSFYLILVSARSMVGYFYSVEEFALFNFAHYLAQAIAMFLGSISFLFYPKMLNKFSSYNDNSEIVEFIEKTRKIYLTLTFLIVLFSLFFAPLLFYFLPNYGNSFICFKYLLFAQIILSNCFGYSDLLIQKKQERALIVFGFVSVLIVLVAGAIFVYQFKQPVEFIAIAFLISVMVYNYLVVYAGNKFIKQFKNRYELIKYLYNYRYFIPIVMYVLLDILISNVYFLSMFTIMMYLALNVREITFAYKNGMAIVTNKDSLKVR